ncbi:MAG TPA: hypothetical protein VN455_10690 [Methanotrichaceae archaeon]|nr:hypothetical protein [Methanotrichaceae archaeon]
MSSQPTGFKPEELASGHVTETIGYEKWGICVMEWHHDKEGGYIGGILMKVEYP